MKYEKNKILLNEKYNMDLQKILNYINKFFNKKQTSKKICKRRNSWNFNFILKKQKKLILNKINKTNFTKTRRKLIIKKINFKKFKIFWNNITSYYLLYIFIFIFIILYIILWPVFKIKSINIIKQENITNITIAYKSTDKYRWNSIFNINKDEILNRLQSYQQNIRDIKTNITLPNELNIIIDSYKWIYNTTINGKTFLITQNWTLVPSNYSEELSELIVKNKFNKNNFLDYKKIFNTETINKISYIIPLLKENIIWLKVKEITYYLIEREVHIKTDKNTTIILNLNSNLREQIEKIAIFNKEQINIINTPIIYIDLRIKNKVFYCLKENEKQCNRNIKSIYSFE